MSRRARFGHTKEWVSRRGDACAAIPKPSGTASRTRLHTLRLLATVRIRRWFPRHEVPSWPSIGTLVALAAAGLFIFAVGQGRISLLLIGWILGFVLFFIHRSSGD